MMPYYVTLWKWTEQGIKNVKDSPKRVAAFKAAVEKAGGRTHAFYYTFGKYDGIAITEAPDDATVMGVLLGIAGQGNVRTTTMKAFSESEAKKIIGGLP